MSKSTHTSQDRRKPITITRRLTITSWAHKPNKCKYKYTMLVYNIQHLLVNFKLSALSYSGVLTSNLHFVVDIVSLQLSSLDEPVLLCFSSRFTMLSSLPFCTVSVSVICVPSVPVYSFPTLTEWEFMLRARALHCANHSHLYAVLYPDPSDEHTQLSEERLFFSRSHHQALV